MNVLPVSTHDCDFSSNFLRQNRFLKDSRNSSNASPFVSQCIFDLAWPADLSRVQCSQSRCHGVQESPRTRLDEEIEKARDTHSFRFHTRGQVVSLFCFSLPPSRQKFVAAIGFERTYPQYVTFRVCHNRGVS